MNLDNFLSTLFRPSDIVCFTDMPTGTACYNDPDEHDLFFSINGMAPNDRQPTKPWHAPQVPRRADANVWRHENFLLELDSMALDEQIKYVRDLVPITSCVYSGSKSHHFIISLTEPLETAEAYAQLAKRLHKHVPAADPTTKNPSRLSRLPFRVRPETGKEQKLVYLGTRIPFAELDAILPQLPVYAPKTADQVRTLTSSVILEAIHEPDETMHKFNLGGRNAAFFWLHKRMDELGLDAKAREFFVHTMYNNLRTKDGFSFAEACAAARIKSY